MSTMKLHMLRKCSSSANCEMARSRCTRITSTSVDTAPDAKEHNFEEACIASVRKQSTFAVHGRLDRGASLWLFNLHLSSKNLPNQANVHRRSKRRVHVPKLAGRALAVGVDDRHRRSTADVLQFTLCAWWCDKLSSAILPATTGAWKLSPSQAALLKTASENEPGRRSMQIPPT